MSQFGINFGGRTIVHPGGYSQIKSDAMIVSSPGSSNVPIIVGPASAGEPGVLKWFTGVEEAREYLRGGDLATAVELMFSPIPEGGGGASIVGVMIVNENEQATVTAGGVKFKALEYGDGGNRIQAKLENVSGVRRLTISRWDTNTIEVYDKIGDLFKVVYNGTESAVLTVTTGASGATRLQTVVNSTIDLDINLESAEYSTVDDIVRYINSVSGYSASYVAPYSDSIPATKLDAVTEVSIKGEGGVVTALQSSLVKRIEEDSYLVSADVTSAVTNFESTYLQGGVTGQVPSSWVQYFDAIKKHFSDVLVVLSASESIHAEASMHIAQMESRKQRQVLFTGGDKGETPAKAVQRATTMNNSRAVIAYPGIFHKAVNEGKTALPAYMTAAMIAGRVCGVDPSEPITFDHFNLIALETDLIEGDPRINELLNGGVCTLERVQNGGIRLVQGITTYTGSNNTLLREISVRRGADKLDDNVTRKLEATFVGEKSIAASDSAVTTVVLDVLEEEKKLGNIADYLDQMNIRFVGGAVMVEYQVAPVEPVNFMLVTSRFVPASAFPQAEV
jgi:hypothetical protein